MKHVSELKDGECMYPIDMGGDTSQRCGKRCGDRATFYRNDTKWEMCEKHAREEAGYRLADQKRLQPSSTTTVDDLLNTRFTRIP